MLTHNLGFPRIGSRRELKSACERYWAGLSTLEELVAAGANLRHAHWRLQKEAGIDLIPCNDFSFYDHVLDMTLAMGVIPPRYSPLAGCTEMDLYFAMARGYQKDGYDIIAMEMTKWFDTNYHYIVPEFSKNQIFSLASHKAVREFEEALSVGINPKPVLIGPVTYLMLGKEKDGGFHRLQLLESLLPAFIDLLRKLRDAGAEYVQIDEPFLAMDLDDRAREACRDAFSAIRRAVPELRIVLATYFDGLWDNGKLAVSLPVDVLHLDLVRAPEQLDTVLIDAPDELILSLGVVDGRNVWKNDYSSTLMAVSRAVDRLGPDRVMIAPSCSLLHVPYDLELETDGSVLPAEIRNWLAFARQKLFEVKSIRDLAMTDIQAADSKLLEENIAEVKSRRLSGLIHKPGIKARLDSITTNDLRRASPFSVRRGKQNDSLKLPILPTTTIGSFPQTNDVRKLRSQLQKGEINEAEYEATIELEIEKAIRWQDEIGMDVLVHGEFERNDMVQYFGEQLEGCAFTQNGWVQSYGSRCVKPPLIYGDIVRKAPMTVRWSSFAQSLTQKIVKGMLTGPVTILQWSFVRDDQLRRDTAMQIALAVRDEVLDLEKGGIRIIQIDEPAFREGLPLRLKDRGDYLRWAVECFRMASSGVRDETQIHTHMCYSEFNDIIADIAAMDADVISIETSRSQMELLEAFRNFQYPNAVGPGVYDVHSPRIPLREEIIELLKSALKLVPKDRLWVNPDCGLKTRGWPETKDALVNMIEAAASLR